jgi:hypothetical protein
MYIQFSMFVDNLKHRNSIPLKMLAETVEKQKRLAKKVLVKDLREGLS